MQTPTVLYRSHTLRGMPKAAETSEFWRRLTAMIGEEVTVKQSQVGKIFGVGQSAVTKWKTGKDTPSLPRAMAMADNYGVCVEWLLTGRGPKYPGGQPDADMSRLLEFWKDLPQATRHDVVSYAVFKGTIHQANAPSDVNGKTPPPPRKSRKK